MEYYREGGGHPQGREGVQVKAHIDEGEGIRITGQRTVE